MLWTTLNCVLMTCSNLFAVCLFVCLKASPKCIFLALFLTIQSTESAVWTSNQPNPPSPLPPLPPPTSPLVPETHFEVFQIAGFLPPQGRPGTSKIVLSRLGKDLTPSLQCREREWEKKKFLLLKRNDTWANVLCMCPDQSLLRKLV